MSKPQHPAQLLVTGASGLVGGRLLRSLSARGARARVLSRHPERLTSQPGVEVIGWDGRRVPPAALAATDCVVHLAGEPLFGGLPTSTRMRRIRESRIESTRGVVDALAGLAPADRPRTLLCASATGFYGVRGEEVLDEQSPPGEGFLAELCRDWEEAAKRAEGFGVRRVSLRTGVVLAREGGALALMTPAFRLGLGGPLGDGRQWLSWIHADDLVALIEQLAAAPETSGAVNAVAPGAVRNTDFTRELARVLHRPAWLRVPGFALRIALRELAGELLGSRRVRPARALDLGFAFEHPEIGSALEAELGAQ